MIEENKIIKLKYMMIRMIRFLKLHKNNNNKLVRLKNILWYLLKSRILKIIASDQQVRIELSNRTIKSNFLIHKLITQLKVMIKVLNQD